MTKIETIDTNHIKHTTNTLDCNVFFQVFRVPKEYFGRNQTQQNNPAQTSLIKSTYLNITNMTNESSKQVQKHELSKAGVSASSMQMNTFRQELIDLYMQGWLDRDWKISQDEADEKSEMYADAIMKKYKL